MTFGTRAVAFAIAVSAVMLGACGGSDDSSPTNTQTAPVPTATTTTGPLVGLVRFARAAEDPVEVVAVPNSDEVWVVERPGRVRPITANEALGAPVLDVAARVRSGGEQGLLSVAIHPDAPRDPRVFVHYTDLDGNTRVDQLTRSAAGGVSPTPDRVLLTQNQPFANHNGGRLAFGPDGRLYLGLGDGGSANDPEGNGQDLGTRLGKLLRIDVDDASAEWEIAAYGLRNPWRFAFDPATGDAWIGDVGQNQWEEVNVFPRGSGLRNYGWDVYEGRDESDADGRSDLQDRGELTSPVVQYDRDGGCSITGGVVIRNPAFGDLDGRYIYGDFCTGNVWTVPAGGPYEPRREPFTVPDLSSIDSSADGDVYFTQLGGTIFRLATSP